MNGLLLVAALAALPVGAARYRVELGSAPVGVAELSVRCAEDRCALRWETRLRLPAEAGGGIVGRTLEMEVRADGVWEGGALVVEEAGRTRPGRGVTGAVPATAAELLLAGAGSGREARCLDAFDEASGARGRACARRGEGGRVRADLLGDALALRPGPGGFPAEVAIPAQGARFVADLAAAVPAEPPALAGTEVPGPADLRGPLRFCGVEADPAPSGPPPASAPAPRAPGASCREKTAAWLAAAARAGLDGRTAVGVAWDGGAFVWHAWAEVREGDRWIPVDPSFGQAPARGPRFTLGRWAPGDEAVRAAAGRRVLACWGRAAVTRAR